MNHYLRLIKLLVFIIATGYSSVNVAAEKVVLLGLLGKSKAVVEIDGKRKVLTKGVAYSGVILHKIKNNQAVLSVGGVKENYSLGQQGQITYSKPKSKKVRILKNKYGMFHTPGSINGQLIDFLVDTGATFIALNANHAKKLGIPFRYKGTKIGLSTANGYTTGYQLKLKSVQVGTIRLYNIDAVVHDSDSPRQALLGMSFLGKLNMENKDGLLILKKKY